MSAETSTVTIDAFEQSVELTPEPSESRGEEEEDNKATVVVEESAVGFTASAELRKRKPAGKEEASEGQQMYAQQPVYQPPHCQPQPPLHHFDEEAVLARPLPPRYYEDENCCRWGVAAQKCMTGGKVLAVVLGIVAFALVIFVLARTQSSIVQSTDTMKDYSGDLSQRRVQYMATIDHAMNLLDAATSDQSAGGTPFADQVRSAREDLGGLMDNMKDVAKTLKDIDLASAIRDAAAGFGVFKEIMDSIKESGRLHVILQLEKN